MTERNLNLFELLTGETPPNVRGDTTISLLDAVASWLKRNPNVDVRDWMDDYENNVVALAVMRGDLDVLRLILEKCKGLNIDHPNDDGEAALELAAQLGNMAMVELLIQHGADINVSDGGPLCHAIQKDHDDIVKLLLACGAEFDQYPALGAICANGTKYLERFLDEGRIDPNMKLDGCSEWPNPTLLGHAIDDQKQEHVGVLLGAGAQPTAADIKLADEHCSSTYLSDDQRERALAIRQMLKTHANRKMLKTHANRKRSRGNSRSEESNKRQK